MTRVDSTLISDWHVVADIETLKDDTITTTYLFGERIQIERNHLKSISVTTDSGREVISRQKYGFVWVCLGEPGRPIIEIPEAEENDRHVITGGSMGVHVSGLRVVENFLDMGHFPFVHDGYLGVETNSETFPYQVDITADDEIVATDCKFFQPVASPNAEGGIMADYEYQVLRPYTAVLYKTNPLQPHRKDYIAIFVQPAGEEHCIVHPFLCYLKDGIDRCTVRWFMQLIFGQDKPILENQLPKCLPLDPRAETCIASDATSVFYRRWLREHNITYGAIPIDSASNFSESKSGDIIR